ncbi:MAG: UPF0149 family protein [Proteobacteria bacterium]|nr:UPF0149 family protein [Pseudomonadota bacterium]
MNEKQHFWPDYELFDHQLFVASTPFSPAYIHGMISAMLCVATPEEAGKSIEKEIPSLGQSGVVNELFNALLINTKMDLENDQRAFRLMLPSDEESLVQRVEGVTNWCEGFLQGISCTNMSGLLNDNPIVKEVLADIEQIKEASLEVQEGEENEKDFMEIVEFIKVSVMLVYAQVIEQQVKAKQLH